MESRRPRPVGYCEESENTKHGKRSLLSFFCFASFLFLLFFFFSFFLLFFPFLLYFFNTLFSLFSFVFFHQKEKRKKKKKERNEKEKEKRDKDKRNRKEGDGTDSRGNQQAIWEISKCLVDDWQHGTGTVLHCGSPSQSLRLTTPPRTNLADVREEREVPPQTSLSSTVGVAGGCSSCANDTRNELE